MKKALFGALVTAALFASGHAGAADLLARAPVAQTFSWTGFYVGVNAGYGWKDPTVSYTSNDISAFVATCGAAFGNTTCVPPASFNVGGALGGGQVGYNWQFDQRWVAGLEADFDGASIKGTGTSNFLIANPSPANF